MSHVLFDDVVMTDYGQLDLLWTDEGGFDGDWDRFFAGQANGLVGAGDPHGIYVNLARRSGGSRVRIEVTKSEPPLLDATFDDVVEVSTTIPAGASPRLEAWGGMGSAALHELESGTYRVRVSASGRDAGDADEFADGVVDEYVIQLWPAAVEPDRIVHTVSQNAAYWHAEITGRRSAP